MTQSESSDSTTILMPVHLTGRALKGVQATRDRVDTCLLPIAFWLGCLGTVVLCVCVTVLLQPQILLPAPLSRAQLPLYTVTSLALSSLLGWGCMQRGMGRLREGLGDTLGGWLFVLFPLACFAAVQLQNHGYLEMQSLPHGHRLQLLATWYPPLIVSLSLLAYITLKARPEQRIQYGRGVWFLFLVMPYALLLAVLVFQIPIPFVGTELKEMAQELGSTAILLQIMLAFFVGTSSGG